MTAEFSLRRVSGIFTSQPAKNVAPSQVHDFMESPFGGIIPASIRPWLIADFEKGLIMKMFAKSTVLAGVTAALLGFSMSAAAVAPTDFTGAYAVGNWIQFTDPPSSSEQGTFGLGGAPSSITLVGWGDQGDDQARDTTFTILASSASVVSFNWSYSTADIDGPAFDPARFLKGGTPLQFSDDNGSSIQSGFYSNSVAMGQSFGFSVLSPDSSGGAATLTISNFNVSAVPEPGSLAMLTAGLMVVAAARRRKQY